MADQCLDKYTSIDKVTVTVNRRLLVAPVQCNLSARESIMVLQVSLCTNRQDFDPSFSDSAEQEG